MLPIHKTSFLSYLLPQMATKRLALFARCGIYRIAPSGLSQLVPAAVEAVLVAEAQAAAEALLLAVCLQDPPPAAARQPLRHDCMPAAGVKRSHGQCSLLMDLHSRICACQCPCSDEDAARRTGVHKQWCEARCSTGHSTDQTQLSYAQAKHTAPHGSYACSAC